MEITIAFIKGSAPGKWFDRFNQWTPHSIHSYEAVDAWEKLHTGQADMAFVRLPDARITPDYHCVVLYEEQWGCVVNKDNELSLLESISLDDVTQETLNYQGFSVPAVLDAVQLTAANVGITIAPRPLLRSINNKECTHRDYVDANLEPTRIALMWPVDKDCDEYQEFVGITKGRRKNSSRGKKK